MPSYPSRRHLAKLANCAKHENCPPGEPPISAEPRRDAVCAQPRRHKQHDHLLPQLHGHRKVVREHDRCAGARSSSLWPDAPSQTKG